MRGGTKAPDDNGLRIDAFQESIERQVEIEPRLFSVRHDIQARGLLIMQRTHHRIVLRLCEVGGTKTIEVFSSELQPAGERITANHGRA